MSIFVVNFLGRFWSILSILVDLVDLWPVDTKMGFERPCQSTLGSPIDFNGNLDLTVQHWFYGEEKL